MEATETPKCPACRAELRVKVRLCDMTGYQLVYCGQCGFTLGAVNYF